jgi:hypothetical protein
LLADSPINCLLLKTYSTDFVAAAQKRGLVTLAVILPGTDAIAAARRALAANVTGILLEGSFPEGTAAAVQQAVRSDPVIQLTARSRLPLGSNAAIIGTYQAVWPGIAIEENGATKGGPTGTIWIDTNTGFIRAVRAWGDATLWIAADPPPKTIITGERYLQVIADAAVSGARWVLALDDDFAARLNNRQPAAMRDWRRITDLLLYFERHPEWRQMAEYGKLAVVQDPAHGGLLTGGVLDMLAAKHMPARPIPRQFLTPEPNSRPEYHSGPRFRRAHDRPGTSAARVHERRRNSPDRPAHLEKCRPRRRPVHAQQGRIRRTGRPVEGAEFENATQQFWRAPLQCQLDAFQCPGLRRRQNHRRASCELFGLPG